MIRMIGVLLKLFYEIKQAFVRQQTADIEKLKSNNETAAWEQSAAAASVLKLFKWQ